MPLEALNLVDYHDVVNPNIKAGIIFTVFFLKLF